MQDRINIFESVASGLLFPKLNAPSLRSAHVHTRNGNRAGKTFEINSSKPLAAPSMDDELSITSPTQSNRVMIIQTVFITEKYAVKLICIR